MKSKLDLIMFLALGLGAYLLYDGKDVGGLFLMMGLFWFFLSWLVNKATRWANSQPGSVNGVTVQPETHNEFGTPWDKVVKFWKVRNANNPMEVTDQQFKESLGMSRLEYIQKHGGLEHVDSNDLNLILDDQTMSSDDRQTFEIEKRRRSAGRDTAPRGFRL